MSCSIQLCLGLWELRGKLTSPKSGRNPKLVTLHQNKKAVSKAPDPEP